MKRTANRNQPGPEDQTLMMRVPDYPTGIGDNAPYLRIIHPRDADASFALDESGLILGRGADSDVPLSAAMISRQHCTVRCAANGVLVEDLGSTNGTFIDGQRVKTGFLAPDSRLKVGPFVLKVEYKGAVELSAENQLREAARLDTLTGIPNRGWFVKQAARLLADIDAPEIWLTTVMVDIDHFKRINDRHGHAAGDAVIRSVAQGLQREMRDRDLFGRYGGEEFVMILPHTDRQDALIFCDRIRESIAATTIHIDKLVLQARVSMGICSRLRGEVVTLDAMISAADTAMYRAKKKGRDRVCF